MFSQSFRASRQSLVRVARAQSGQTFRRTFITSAPRQADLVQDLYLKELKAYKTPAVKPNDSEGHVQTFHIPSAPQSPEEADIAKDLSAYETQVPEVEGQAEGGAAAPVEDWFDESIFEDEEPHH